MAAAGAAVPLVSFPTEELAERKQQQVQAKTAQIQRLHGRSRTTYIWATMLGPAIRFFVAYLATVVTGTSKSTGSSARAWAVRNINVMIL